MIKHIFSDMDGTLLDEHGHVTDVTARALIDSKIPVTLVSARAPMEMAAAIDKLQLTEPQIGFNGGLIYQRGTDGWVTISERYIEARTALAILTAVRSEFPRVSLSFYDRDHWYAERIDDGIKFEEKLTGLNATQSHFDELLSDGSRHVFKIMMIIFDDAEMARLNAFFAQHHFAGISVAQSGAAYLEITSDEAKKSRGIEYILQTEGLQRDDTAAFGDGHNDLPMLKMVGTPVVMANAFPEIKAIAKFVTRSNTEDGIAYALQHFGLID
jgi:Cof subfamily protein (haloacid dehalogenase superfamily)